MHMTTTITQPATKTEPKTREVIALPPGEGDAIWFLDNFITVKASARSGARIGFAESVLPAGSEAPMHRHHDEDESFYILEGKMTFFLEGGRVVEAEPGSFLHIPAGIAHGFRANTALKMIVVTDPRGFVEFIREYGVPAERRELPLAAPPDVPRLVAVAEKHRVEVLGPTPGHTAT